MARQYILKQAIASAIQFPRLALRSLHLRGERLGYRYTIEQASQYAIFRETVSTRIIDESPVVLVIGFRLKIIGSHPSWHWLFQRCCIITTPFWSGFLGFQTKLWMVDPGSKNYLGIYQWFGERNAHRYIDFLLPVLRFFSVKKSVWYRFYPEMKLEEYLLPRLANT